MFRFVSFSSAVGLASFSLLFPCQFMVIYVLVGFRTTSSSIISHLCTPVPLTVFDKVTEIVMTFPNLLTWNSEPAWCGFKLHHVWGDFGHLHQEPAHHGAASIM